jgi:hypothetical protein
MSKVNWLSLKHVLVSLNNQTVTECHEHIQTLIHNSTSESKVTRLNALSSLLDEIFVHKVLTFDHAFDEYAGKILWVADAKDRGQAKKTFRRVILANNGIPVVVIENKGQRWVWIYQFH